MKKKVIIIVSVIFILSLFLVLLPLVKIDKNNTIKYIAFSDDISEYDEITCYDDGMSYYKKKDITIKEIDIEKKLFFYVLTLKYEKGNLCDSEFILEESYIENFLENAKIISNENNIDLNNLIKDKKVIIKNKRYSGNDYDTFIEYKLDGKYQIMYIFYVDDLLVIQIGHSDEGPKFIAYK